MIIYKDSRNIIEINKNKEKRLRTVRFLQQKSSYSRETQLLQIGTNNIIVETDSHVTTDFIIDETQILRQICNLVKNIRKLASMFLNIRFRYCNRCINSIRKIGKKDALFVRKQVL